VIHDASREDLASLVATLSDSFACDPILNWVIPRPALYPGFFTLIIRDVYLPRGIIHREERGRGASLWLPPEERFEIPPRFELLTMMLDLLLHKGPVPLWRIHRQGSLFARYHPREPHFYLQFIGCRQRDQGRGIGAALLKQGTRICDQQSMPAYLESSNPRNLPLYQRHGFEVINEITLPGGGPRGWFMWREAR
jgi:GNAT superfamily N-acetyltransferase